MRKLGLIGGTSWYSTVEYYRGINTMYSDQMGKQTNPELILYSINIEVMRRQDEEEIRSKYLTVAQKLEQAGADGIVICANTPHLVFDHVQPQISIPILHIAHAIGQAAKEHDMQKLALLGTRPTMRGDFIQGPLNKDFGIETIIPDEKNADKTHEFIADELTQGIFSDSAKEFFIQETDQLKNKGAEGIILGCTELPILLKDEKLSVPALATTDLHIKMAVEFLIEKN
ncbi:aspartate/glutamate racemase family protein [Ekhidna sp.]|uniref:aspartate/glutamate racemase family protein n=1 Tax=Ekhidna sp. TaxID=2608089 RepID=UPI003CCC38FC